MFPAAGARGRPSWERAAERVEDGLFRTQQDRRCGSGHRPRRHGREHHFGGHLFARRTGQARLRDRGERHQRSGRAPAAGPAAAYRWPRSPSACRRQTRRRARRRPRNAWPATRWKRASRTRSAPTSTAWSARRSSARKRLQIFLGLPGQEQGRLHLDLRASRRIPDQPAHRHPGHGDVVRRHQEAGRARRRDRLSAHALRQPGAAAPAPAPSGRQGRCSAGSRRGH